MRFRKSSPFCTSYPSSFPGIAAANPVFRPSFSVDKASPGAHPVKGPAKSQRATPVTVLDLGTGTGGTKCESSIKFPRLLEQQSPDLVPVFRTNSWLACAVTVGAFLGGLTCELWWRPEMEVSKEPGSDKIARGRHV